MPFILSEDAALKQKLQNFTLTNTASSTQKPIAVYFRFPDQEEVTRTFPHVAIDLVEANYDPTRAHRAWDYQFTYATDEVPHPTGTQSAYDFPIPFTLVYQLACYSRNPRHDRQMMAMMFSLFPAYFGFLDMTAQDGTVRRADYVSTVRRDTVDNEKKRLYRFIYTVAISSELLLGQVIQLQEATHVVLDVVLDVNGLVVPV
jgi:hypothetical protein